MYVYDGYCTSTEIRKTNYLFQVNEKWFAKFSKSQKQRQSVK